MKLFIKNIKQLLLATEQAPEIAKGKAMNQIPIIEDAWLAVEDGKIADFGKMEDWQNIFANPTHTYSQMVHLGSGKSLPK